MTSNSTEISEVTKNVQWGINAQTGRLTDVLLGRPNHFGWVPLNAISAGNQANQDRMGYRFDKARAMQQHRDMVEVYESQGVRCHFVDADEGLPSSVFTRDSSFMTPWGMIIGQMAQWWRRGEYGRIRSIGSGCP